MGAESNSRPMGSVETFFGVLSGIGALSNREHGTLFTVLSLRFPSSIHDSELYLARAWQIIGHRYPALGSTLCSPDPSDPHMRQVLSAAHYTPEEWVRETFSKHTECSHVDELLADMGRPSTIRCCWLPGPGQLVFRTSHWRIDGIGLALLADTFTTTLADVIRLGLDAPLTEGTCPLITASLEALAKSESQIKPDVYPKNLVEAAGKLVSSFLGGMPSIGLPTKDGSEAAPPGASARAQILLDTATTSKVALTSKSQGFSVTCAIQAAIIRIVARFQQHPYATNYTSLGPIDLRGLLKIKGIPESSQPYGVLQSGLPVCINPYGHGATNAAKTYKDYKSIAHELQAIYATDMEKYCLLEDGSHASFIDVAEPYIDGLLQGLGGPTPVDLAQVTTPDLSSLGKLEKYLRYEYAASDELDGPKLGLSSYRMGIEIATRILCFHLWSWKGELILSVSWNQSYYERVFVHSLLQAITVEVGQGLDMPGMSYRLEA